MSTNPDTYTLIMQSTISLAGVLVTAVLTYFFAQRRYAFEKAYDRKLVCLEELYEKTVSYEKGLKIYISTIGSDMADESRNKKQKALGALQGEFFDLQDYFKRKEIMLDECSVAIVQSFIDIHVEIVANLIASSISSSINDQEVSFKQWLSAYDGMKDALPLVKTQLKKDFKLSLRG